MRQQYAKQRSDTGPQGLRGHHSMHRSRIQAGASLFELIMTVMLAALVAGLGLPSFAGLMADKRLRVESDALFHAVHLARKYSIVRRRVISLCPSADLERCTPGTDWSAGWILFENVGRTDTDVRSPDETLLDARRVDPTVNISANRRSFSFRSTHLRATNGSLVICDQKNRARSRAVVVSYTGRPRVAREDQRGDLYRCAR